MKTLIVGGDFGDFPNASSVITKIGEEFIEHEIVNGGTLNELPIDINSDLILWMPNISNETKKQYPIKNLGNVLIVSKVMRSNYTNFDAISRIFSMQGNAVIAIYKEEKFRFKLIDSLGNVWYNGYNINLLCDKIKDFFYFTRSAIRCRTTKIDIKIPNTTDDVLEFIELNKTLANHIQTSCGERFFGNLSTRCSKLFPTFRKNVGIFVSPRNIDKETILSTDMVYCEFEENNIYYVGEHKPSVDTPIQLKVYKECEQINFMIHGHSFINGSVETKEYFLCGDLRESKEVIDIIQNNRYGTINLKNHGFLLYSDTLENMKKLIQSLNFSYRRE